MEKKYWVPAIEKVNTVLMIVAKDPRRLKLMEIAEKSNVNKSSLFSILNTLEELGWVYKESDQTYSLGAKLGFLGAQYIEQFDLTRVFDQEAEKTVRKVEETIQLSVLDGREIIYIAKKEGLSRVRVASEPGMRFPAHATAMGKAMLSSFTNEELALIYKENGLEKLTDYTVDNLSDLVIQLEEIKKNGYIIEFQEAVKGFTCIGAPVLNERREIIAAVSITMDRDNWIQKSDICKAEILALSRRLSMNS